MHDIDTAAGAGMDLRSPVRNHYFHGKMMDAYHFQLETQYHNDLRALINRLALGHGVVCGLNVEKAKDPHAIDLRSGVAIDRWGREIVVPVDFTDITLPKWVVLSALKAAEKRDRDDYDDDHHHDDDDDDDRGWITVLLCYHECLGNPMPVLAGDCHGGQACAPGTVREWFELQYSVGRARKPRVECAIPNLVSRTKLNRREIVKWVTEGCKEMPRDPCIPIAEVRVVSWHQTWKIKEVDIYRRPVAFTNRMLYEIFLDLVQGDDTSSW